MTWQVIAQGEPPIPIRSWPTLEYVLAAAIVAGYIISVTGKKIIDLVNDWFAMRRDARVKDAQALDGTWLQAYENLEQRHNKTLLELKECRQERDESERRVDLLLNKLFEAGMTLGSGTAWSALQQHPRSLENRQNPNPGSQV